MVFLLNVYLNVYRQESQKAQKAGKVEREEKLAKANPKKPPNQGHLKLGSK